jgi:regulatory protein
MGWLLWASTHSTGGEMPANPYEYALNLLTQRAYTVRNLRRKLLQRGFEAVDAERVIERLQASGLLDDQKFAAEFARQRLVAAGASVRRVEQDLMRRGISSDLAKAATRTVVGEEQVDFQGSMERLARKKLAIMGDLEPEIKRRRLFGFLARRGYELEDINRTLSRILP